MRRSGRAVVLLKQIAGTDQAGRWNMRFRPMPRAMERRV
jgi:hypothetical protein